MFQKAVQSSEPTTIRS